MTSRIFSDALVRWLDNFSQSAAVDMCEGGDDPECVAECCLTVVSVHDPALDREVRAAIEAHGYDTVMAEAVRFVRTL